MKDKDGRTPLSWVVGGGHELVVKLLLATGKVEADTRNENKRMPLSLAAEGGHDSEGTATDGQGKGGHERSKWMDAATVGGRRRTRGGGQGAITNGHSGRKQPGLKRRDDQSTREDKGPKCRNIRHYRW